APAGSASLAQPALLGGTCHCAPVTAQDRPFDQPAFLAVGQSRRQPGSSPPLGIQQGGRQEVTRGSALDEKVEKAGRRAQLIEHAGATALRNHSGLGMGMSAPLDELIDLRKLPSDAPLQPAVE